MKDRVLHNYLKIRKIIKILFIFSFLNDTESEDNNRPVDIEGECDEVVRGHSRKTSNAKLTLFPKSEKAEKVEKIEKLEKTEKEDEKKQFKNPKSPCIRSETNSIQNFYKNNSTKNSKENLVLKPCQMETTITKPSYPSFLNSGCSFHHSKTNSTSHLTEQIQNETFSSKILQENKNNGNLYKKPVVMNYTNTQSATSSTKTHKFSLKNSLNQHGPNFSKFEINILENSECNTKIVSKEEIQIVFLVHKTDWTNTKSNFY